METKFNRNKIIQNLVVTAIDNVAEHSVNYFDFKEEETIEKEIEFYYNQDIIGDIVYEAFSRCTHKGIGQPSYYDIPDYDEYDFFYENIDVRIINEKGRELTNLSELVNIELHKNKRRQLN